MKGRRSGLLALAFCVAHAVELGLRMAPENQLWSCNVACLVAALGLLSGSAMLNAAGGILLLVAEPVWIYDLWHGGRFLPTSLLTHVGVAALSVLGMRRLGAPWRAWPAAVATLAAATVVSAWASSPAENVNVALVTPRGFLWFPSHGWYMAWLGTTLCLAMLGLLFVVRRVLRPPAEPPETQGARALTWGALGALLAALAAAFVFTYRDGPPRRARHDWSHTLRVGLVLVKLGPVRGEVASALHERLFVLDDVLVAEARRHLGPTPHTPLQLVMFRSVDLAETPPRLDGNGVIASIRYAWARSRYAARVEEASEIGDMAHLDARIYLVARADRAGGASVVEGLCEQGGRPCLVELDLERTAIDYALFVTAHELGHLLGATDKSDPSGAAKVPDGLAEPDADPRFPQRYVELMARGRPIAPGEERPLESVLQLRVGRATAREIGWLEAIPRPAPGSR